MGIRRGGETPEPSKRGLRALGDQIDGRARGERALGEVAGGDRLRALGDAIDRQGTVRSDAPGRPARASAPDGSRRGVRRIRWSTRRRILTILVGLVALALVAGGGLYVYARYRYGQIEKVTVADLRPVGSGQPFNLLVIGSDSRLGAKASTGVGTSTQVSGQRSDVVMIWHVVPATKKITILSIPRDTMTQMVGHDATEFGRFNRINASYNGGPSLLVETIEDNFGIPINHVVEVDFAGFKGAVDALGGVYMDFPYPARDAWSGLDETTTGCRLLDGEEALSVARSRHYQYEVNGEWIDTPIGDLGRIKRQDAFLRALVQAAKRELNPLKLNDFLGAVPQGLVVDKTFSLDDMLHLALDFHSLTPNAISTYTLPTTTVGAVTPWGDVLFVDQPADQQLLVRVFGDELVGPSAPPPGTTLQPEYPPSLPEPGSTAGAAPKGDTTAATSSASVTPPNSTPTFDPAPCSP
ncbi:MAG TPA: LCP family protein [Acidimicrobiales bacterium]|nr:LCP family protein [Acidimicrobiales bacterium]